MTWKSARGPSLWREFLTSEEIAIVRKHDKAVAEIARAKKALGPLQQQFNTIRNRAVHRARSRSHE